MRCCINYGITAVLAFGAFLAGVPDSYANETIRVITTGKGAALQLPLYIGISKGFFQSRGVDIDVSAASSSASAIQQVTAGAGDLGVGGVLDPIRAIDKGAGLSILLVESSKAPYSLWAKPSITNIGALKGKIVSVGLINDMSRYFVDVMTAANGLKDGDYDRNNAATTPARYAALLSGAADAAILYPPASFLAPKAGFTKLGELSDFLKGFPFTTYTVNLTWAKSHKSAIRAFVQGYNQAVTWFYDPNNKQEAIDILKKNTGSDIETNTDTYAYFTSLHIYPDTAGVSSADLTTMLDIIQDNAYLGRLEGKYDPKRFIDPEVNALLGTTR